MSVRDRIEQITDGQKTDKALKEHHDAKEKRQADRKKSQRLAKKEQEILDDLKDDDDQRRGDDGRFTPAVDYDDPVTKRVVVNRLGTELHGKYYTNMSRSDPEEWADYIDKPRNNPLTRNDARNKANSLLDLELQKRDSHLDRRQGRGYKDHCRIWQAATGTDFSEFLIEVEQRLKDDPRILELARWM